MYGGTSGLTLYLMVSTWAGNNLQTPSGGLLTPLNAPSTATTNITVTGAVSDALALWRTRPQTQIIDTCFWGLSDVTLLPNVGGLAVNTGDGAFPGGASGAWNPVTFAGGRITLAIKRLP